MRHSPPLALQAAVTVARRVAEEMGCEVGRDVGYAVRFEERTCASTRIKYLTGGIPTPIGLLPASPGRPFARPG